MQLTLLSSDFEFCVDLPLETASVIEQQLHRIDGDESRRAFVQAVLRQLTQLMSDVFDPDLRPPTDKQVAFALSIGRQRKVPIPKEALMYRSAMSDFLSKYAHKGR